MLVPDVRTAVIRSEVLGVLHGWADADRGRTVSEAEFFGLLRACYAPATPCSVTTWCDYVVRVKAGLDEWYIDLTAAQFPDLGYEGPIVRGHYGW